MASLKEIKTRIGSVKSTQQITSAMKMVSSAKLHRAQALIESIYPYQQKMYGILSRLFASDIVFNSPLTDERIIKNVAIVAVSSNTSLCGAFNSNMIKKFIGVVQQYAEVGLNHITVYPIGKKIEEAVVKMEGINKGGSFQTLASNPTYNKARDLSHKLIRDYVNGEIDKVVLVYHHFRSAGLQELIEEQFLPINLSQLKNGTDAAGTANKFNFDYIVEPSVEEFITTVLPNVLSQKLFTVLADSNASEHAARMVAMQTANDNATNLISDLTIQYNKGRQQAITNELLDIIGGSFK